MDRVRAMHLARRLPDGHLADAAYAGLQDSAPRAALLSLHARVDGVTPESWDDPALVQVWGPRMAAYVVPADAIAAFTLGRLPRDANAHARIVALSDRVLDVLDGSPMRSNRLFAAFRELPNPVVARAACAAGRFRIRWDARTTTVIPIERPEVDEEEARVDLVHRYASWFGTSGGAVRFARWAGIDLSDAVATWERLTSCDEPATTGPMTGVRFLPSGDPYLYGRHPPTSAEREIPGVVLVDGRRAGTWARQQRRLTIRPASRASSARLDRMTSAAHELRGPLGGPVAITIA